MNSPFQAEQWHILPANPNDPLHTLRHLASSRVILKEIYIIKNILPLAQHFRNSVTIVHLFLSVFLILVIKVSFINKT